MVASAALLGTYHRSLAVMDALGVGDARQRDVRQWLPPPRSHPARSQDRPQFHPCEALVEPRIRAQAVPLRRHGEMNQRRVARVDQALKMLEGRVEVSSLCVVHHEREFAMANVGLCRAI